MNKTRDQFVIIRLSVREKAILIKRLPLKTSNLSRFIRKLLGFE